MGRAKYLERWIARASLLKRMGRRRTTPKQRLVRLGYGLVFAACCSVAAINAGVRVAGGAQVFIYSPFHLREKAHALVAFALHGPAHLFGVCEGTPHKHVRAAAKKYGVPVALAEAVAHHESTFNAHAISHAGAMGLMQIMPDTAEHLDLGDPFDPEENAEAGVRYLKWLLRRYDGDTRRAVAAYNLGPYAVPRQGTLRLPAETRLYTERVLARAEPKKAPTSPPAPGSTAGPGRGRGSAAPRR